VDSQEVEANIEELERNVTYGGEDDEYMEETMGRSYERLSSEEAKDIWN
jgi:hypothetical protein